MRKSAFSLAHGLGANITANTLHGNGPRSRIGVTHDISYVINI